MKVIPLQQPASAPCLQNAEMERLGRRGNGVTWRKGSCSASASSLLAAKDLADVFTNLADDAGTSGSITWNTRETWGGERGWNAILAAQQLACGPQSRYREHRRSRSCHARLRQLHADEEAAGVEAAEGEDLLRNTVHPPCPCSHTRVQHFHTKNASKNVAGQHATTRLLQN